MIGTLRGRHYLLALLCLSALAIVTWSGTAPSNGATQPPPEQPTLSDTGILTEWPLPPNRGPWQLKWDSLRNLIWFSEGTHSDPPLDQIGALDPDTSLLKEWGIPTAGGYVHGTAIDHSFNIWFTEVRQNRIGRLVPETNTITEWTLDPAGFPHGIAIDDSVPDSTRVWFTERDTDKVSSLDLNTGVYMRHAHPLGPAWPHSVVVAPDHSVWFVETCGNRVGQLVSSGGVDTWTFWRPPTTGGLCSPPNNIGPLFGNFVNGDFWYAEPYNGRLIRLEPALNRFTMWSVPSAGGGGRLITRTRQRQDVSVVRRPLVSRQLRHPWALEHERRATAVGGDDRIPRHTLAARRRIVAPADEEPRAVVRPQVRQTFELLVEDGPQDVVAGTVGVDDVRAGEGGEVDRPRRVREAIAGR